MKQPAVEEVRSYWTESKLVGSPDEFYDHFEANGWMVGRVPMKNWQAAARNWSRNEVRYGGRNGSVRAVPETVSWLDFPPGSPERAAALSKAKP